MLTVRLGVIFANLEGRFLISFSNLGGRTFSHKLISTLLVRGVGVIGIPGHFRTKFPLSASGKSVVGLLIRRRPLYPTELRRQIRKRCAVREKTLHSTRPFLIITTLSLLCQSISFCFSFMKYVRNVGFHSTQILHVMQAFA